MTLEELVINLVECRDAAKAASDAYAEKAAEVGDCTDRDKQEGPCWYCCPSRPCDPCAARMPLYQAKQKASRAAGGALRRVINAGRILQRELSDEAVAALEQAESRDDINSALAGFSPEYLASCGIV